MTQRVEVIDLVGDDEDDEVHDVEMVEVENQSERPQTSLESKPASQSSSSSSSSSSYSSSNLSSSSSSTQTRLPPPVSSSAMQWTSKLKEHESKNDPYFVLRVMTMPIQRQKQMDRFSCGYQNATMIWSAFRSEQPLPSVQEMQVMLERAWRDGFDAEGAAQFGGKVVGRQQWVGVTDVAALMRSQGLPASIVDFHSGSVDLLSFVWECFDRGPSAALMLPCSPLQAGVRPPLMLQYQTHSVTIVGAARRKSGGAIKLLCFDPFVKSTLEAARSALLLSWQCLLLPEEKLRKLRYQILIPGLEGDPNSLSPVVVAVRAFGHNGTNAPVASEALQRNPAQTSKARCRSGHLLSCFITPPFPVHICNRCNTRNPSQVPCFGCSTCDFALCSSCLGVRCGQHHILTPFLTPSISTFQRPLLYECDGCDAVLSPQSLAFGCRICRYDLCSVCMGRFS